MYQSWKGTFYINTKSRNLDDLLGNIKRSYVLHSKQLDTYILQGLEILGLKDQRQVTTLYHDLLKRENYIARILSHFDRTNSKSNIGTSTIATISYHCIRHATPLGHQWSFNKYVTVKVSILTLLPAPPYVTTCNVWHDTPSLLRNVFYKIPLPQETNMK